MYPHDHTEAQPPQHPYLPHREHISYNRQTHMDMSLAPLTCFTLQLLLGVVHTVGLQTCAMTHVYHYCLDGSFLDCDVIKNVSFS